MGIQRTARRACTCTTCARGGCVHVFVWWRWCTSLRWPYGSTHEGKEGQTRLGLLSDAGPHRKLLANTHTSTNTHLQSNMHTYTQMLYNVSWCLSGNEAGVEGWQACLPLPYARGVTQLQLEEWQKAAVATDMHKDRCTQTHTHKHKHTERTQNNFLCAQE